MTKYPPFPRGFWKAITISAFVGILMPAILGFIVLSKFINPVNWWAIASVPVCEFIISWIVSNRLSKILLKRFNTPKGMYKCSSCEEFHSFDE